MSGYLELKYPFKSNIGLNPFKTWKRQWCILRPSPTRAGGGSLAMYSAEAGSVAGCLEFSAGSVVRRTKSRSRPHAFAVFAPKDAHKPRILLAAPSAHDAQQWMDKIRNLLNDLGSLDRSDIPLKDWYSVHVSESALSRAVSFADADGILTLSAAGVTLAEPAPKQHRIIIPWIHISDIENNTDKNKLTINVDSGWSAGAGEISLRCPLAAQLSGELRHALRRRTRRLSVSAGDLTHIAALAEDRDGSWGRGKGRSIDDTGLGMAKNDPRGLVQTSCENKMASPMIVAPSASVEDSSFDRRSLLSVASGVYEEIPDLSSDTVDGSPLTGVAGCVVGLPPTGGAGKTHGKALRDKLHGLDEPTYESVAECVYATMRRTGKRYLPPPLPPRLPLGASKSNESWSCSLGSLPRCRSVGVAGEAAGTHHHYRTLPTFERSKQAFSAFRKRLKSDSRINTSPKSEATKENKPIETKKKKFEFTPTKDIFKNFKVGRRMRGLKITSTNLNKIGETKSCEFLDDSTEHVTTNRCSKSVECLDDKSEFNDDLDEIDLSIDCNDDAVASFTLPQDIVDLILQNRNKVQRVELGEDDYMPMSPIVAPSPPIEQHYIVMSPRTNIA